MIFVKEEPVVQATGKEGGRFKYDKLEYNKSSKGCRGEIGERRSIYIPCIRPLSEK